MESICNCPPLSQQVNQTNSQCLRDVRNLIRTANAQLWHEAKYSQEHLTGADLYTAVILFLFASIIILLMIRAIKPSETLDDQVTLLLNSMRVRVEYEDQARQKRKLREAKRRAQRWLAEAKNKGVRKLSFRRAHSTSDAAVDKMSVNSTPAVGLAPKKAYQRAASYHQFVPQIVVTSETHQISIEDSSPLSAPFSRASSSFSFDEVSQHSMQSRKNEVDEYKTVL
ncbi:hypothetical protein QR680_001273 [Steinernema hermaphroditum]|uniref:Uncharacterized protein n=1 Tax=Steinernema hermaphroditum TaxID=289476 RepID=A0AA39LFN8_9BILA|nr:hypothetical protein QR680_001273 [Steinernema hermaphroditum]